MRELMKDVIEIEGVNGVLIISDEGETLFKEISSNISVKFEEVNWNFFIDSIREFREIELIYEKGLIYVRKIEFGFILVLIELYVQIAVIRLNCDIVLPSLQNLKSNKKYKKLFKK